MKRERRHFSALVVILVVASLFTGTIASLILYRTALREKSNLLLTEVQNLSRLIGAVAKFDRNTFKDVSKATKATLSQVEDAFKDQIGVGETGEILLGRREGKKIVIFLRYRDHQINQNLVFPYEPTRSEAMGLALKGATGVGQFIDLSGEPVLAAYTYIPYLGTGLEVKVAMVEIIRPYLYSGIVIAIASGGVILFCIFLFLRVSRPVLAELEKYRTLTEAVVESAQDMILTIDDDALLRLVNPAALKVLGYHAADLNARDFSVLFDPADDATMRLIGKIREGNFIDQNDAVVCLRKKNGHVFTASLTSGRKVVLDKSVTTIVLHDLTAIKQSEATIRHLTHKMIEIKDDEQDKISQELHDTIGTNLIWLKLQTQQLTKDLPERKTEADALLQSLDATIEMTRNLSHSLSPIAVEKLGLAITLRRLTERATQVSSAAVIFEEENLDFEFSSRTRFHIFRIVQESLNNALRHSGAKNITVLCRRSGGTLSIAISDDGKGFEYREPSTGLGLSLINERVRLLKGTLRIQAEPGRGTEVHIEFPLA